MPSEKYFELKPATLSAIAADVNDAIRRGSANGGATPVIKQDARGRDMATIAFGGPLQGISVEGKTGRCRIIASANILALASEEERANARVANAFATVDTTRLSASEQAEFAAAQAILARLAGK